MLIESLDGSDTTRVTLSRRNLLALLAKLDLPGSERTIWTTDRQGRRVYVTAEDDAAHYGDRAPGRMARETEVLLPAINSIYR